MSTLDSIASFGAYWLVLLPLVAATAAGAAALVVVGDGRALLTRLGRGAEKVTGYPSWVALPAVTMLGFTLPMAALGFYWDVAWHIDKGRDEFLFSPPHVALLLGLGGIGAAGLLGVSQATLARARTGWKVGRAHVPYGAAALVFAGAISIVGYFVDELWHWAYGLDVSMWGPTHLTMVSAAAFSPFALWALIAEAGPGAGATAVGRIVRPFTAVVTVIGLSAWQLEFDLGVPQWQSLYHPVLVATTAALALTVSRAAIGRGGALVAAVGAASVRVLAGLVVGGLGLTAPRFPLYLGAALAVEAVAAVADRRVWSPVRYGAAAGLAAGTIGLAAEAAWTHVFAFHPWTTNLLPGVWIAVAAAGAAGVLAAAVARVATWRPTGVRAGTVALCFAVLLAAVIAPWFRRVPDTTATVRTAPAGVGFVTVSVEVPPGFGRGADRFEVLSWQGDGSTRVRLVERDPGVFVAERPSPVGGTWKTMVAYASHDRIGAIPVFFPVDEQIDAAEVPVVAERTQPFGSLARALQRESRYGGPAWPAAIAYGWVALSVGGLLALIVAACVALDRRRRAGVWPAGPGPRPLEGTRIVVTGAAGGIGRRLVDALSTHGAHVVGLDRVTGDGLPDLITADLRDVPSTRAAIDAAVEKLGGLDVLVNNAGIGSAADSGAMPGPEAEATLDVNLFGPWRATAAALPALRASGGHVVNVSSGLALATVPYAAAYTASKRGLLAYSDALRMEHGDAIRVSTVLPGYIRTAIHDGPAADGASLDGIARAEPVEGAVAAVVAAIETGRRQVASSPLLAVELFAARHAPAIVEAVLRRRVRRTRSTRPAPVFATA